MVLSNVCLSMQQITNVDSLKRLLIESNNKVCAVHNIRMVYKLGHRVVLSTRFFFYNLEFMHTCINI